MKKILIISPYFAPANAADMQRIRMSLPYFMDMGWEAEVVSCDPKYYEGSIDELLLESIPKSTKIHYVSAFNKKYTSKIGLGSLALRSIWFYKRKVNQLLRKGHFDLIYFSTTEFPICILGAYWKKKFQVPYVIDMQDPWHTDYYENKQKNERPPKYWFSYRLNKYLEPIAMRKVDGLIAVSGQYNRDLIKRYALNVPYTTITFGAFEEDIEIAKTNLNKYPSVLKRKGKIEVGYIGRGGYDMQDAVCILFQVFAKALKEDYKYFDQFYFNFIGTSYAPSGQGKKTIAPLADQLKLGNYINEDPDRIPFYQAINTLADMDILFICGSNDEKYTASKIYPYLLLEKPLLAIFHENSSVVEILRKCSNATVVTFQESDETKEKKIKSFLQQFTEVKYKLNRENFFPYTAKEMTKRQCILFDRAISQKNEH